MVRQHQIEDLVLGMSRIAGRPSRLSPPSTVTLKSVIISSFFLDRRLFFLQMKRKPHREFPDLADLVQVQPSAIAKAIHQFGDFENEVKHPGDEVELLFLNSRRTGPVISPAPATKTPTMSPTYSISMTAKPASPNIFLRH